MTNDKELMQQEPVAEVVEDDFSRQVVGIGRWHTLPNGTKLYTAPQPRQWHGLTDEEVGYIADEYATLQGALRAIEAKLREKNGGGV